MWTKLCIKLKGKHLHTFFYIKANVNKQTDVINTKVTRTWNPAKEQNTFVGWLGLVQFLPYSKVCMSTFRVIRHKWNTALVWLGQATIPTITSMVAVLIVVQNVIVAEVAETEHIQINMATEGNNVRFGYFWTSTTSTYSNLFTYSSSCLSDIWRHSV